MEDETRGFLVLIVNTIAIVLIWMISCLFPGVYLGYGFFENSPGIGNIVFYIYFLASLTLLIRYLRRKWNV